MKNIYVNLQLHADIAAKREIAGLRVKCPNRGYGCHWRGRLGECEVTFILLSSLFSLLETFWFPPTAIMRFSFFLATVYFIYWNCYKITLQKLVYCITRLGNSLITSNLFKRNSALLATAKCRFCLNFNKCELMAVRNKCHCDKKRRNRYPLVHESSVCHSEGSSGMLLISPDSMLYTAMADCAKSVLHLSLWNSQN